MKIRKIGERYDPKFEYYREGDCQIIRKVLFEKGYDATLNDCYHLWAQASADLAASWLNVPDNDDELIWLKVRSKIDEDNAPPEK